ncbi:hypothetical protein LXA43DRAFT_973853 [Ganoderma leucocontextum]|nr:hypothetical protein LXA43DRAFT_973853 [Ganoderma leucocontextum]
MHMTPSLNESAESSSSSTLRNMLYTTQKWLVSEPDASPSAASGPSYSPSLPPYTPVHAPSADPYGNDPTVVNTPLIAPPSPSRLLPSLAGLSADNLPLHPTPTPTLFPPHFPQTPQHRRENVFPYSLNASSPYDHPDRLTSHGSSHPARLDGFPPSSPYTTQNVSLSHSYRPRTSHPVFTSTSALAAHHGIPQSLPPVPRTSKFAAPAPLAAHPPEAPALQTPEFQSLCSHYLTMLSQNPKETPSVPEPANTMHDFADPDGVQAIMDVLQVSPFSEFLTSPMEDSPFDDFLTTPALGSADMSAGLLTSPAIFDADAFPDMGEGSLFGGGFDMLDSMKTHSVAPPSPPSFEDLYTMPSPITPSLDPTSLQPSPHPGTMPTPARRLRKSLPTGTRKNISPDSLVPLSAPIQTRKYVTPSATSRKEVPTAWLKKKRARSQAFGEEDELEDGSKRRQNTLAARRSRKRKLEYQRELEASVEREKEEKEIWKQRAMLYHALLEHHGHEVPSFDTP